MLKINQIWNNILLETEAKVSTLQYDLYINQLQPVGIYRDRLILLAETRALKNIVDNNYKDVIKKCTNVVFPSIIDIEVITENDLDNVGKIEKEVDLPVSSSFVAIGEDKAVFVSQYTFDNFVVGKSNEYAAAVARSVAENPGKTYNPVFLWGGVGLGKTHLMHAIGNSLQRNFPSKKIMYVTCDQFVNEFIESLHDTANPNAMKNFRAKYRKLDVLMMDDVQFLANKEGTQEEMFHTFNELYLADKQIILSSDRPPKEIKIEERLKTRFATGVIADIQPPDLETRIAILQKKCNAKGYVLRINVLSLIAEKITNNIREMEGVLTKVMFLSKLYERKVDRAICQEALKDYRVQECDEITVDEIVDCTCKYYNANKADVLGKKKNKEVVTPRQVAIYLINEFMNIPLAAIGEYFGGREHTTIMHARDKISAQIATDPKIKTAVNDIKAMILRK